MEVIWHKAKGMHSEGLFFRQIAQGIRDNRYVFIWQQQMFPIFNGSGSEVKIRIFVMKIAWIHWYDSLGCFTKIIFPWTFQNHAFIYMDDDIWFRIRVIL